MGSLEDNLCETKCVHISLENSYTLVYHSNSLSPSGRIHIKKGWRHDPG